MEGFVKNFVLGLGAGTLIMGFFLWIQGAARPSPRVEAQPVSHEQAQNQENLAPEAVLKATPQTKANGQQCFVSSPGKSKREASRAGGCSKRRPGLAHSI